MELSKRKSPAKRRFPVPVSPGKMGTICKGDFRLDRSIPRSPGSSRHRLVWFPDPSVMRMRGRGKKGLGNNYTPARALEFDLHVPLSGCG